MHVDQGYAPQLPSTIHGWQSTAGNGNYPVATISDFFLNSSSPMVLFKV